MSSNLSVFFGAEKSLNAERNAFEYRAPKVRIAPRPSLPLCPGKVRLKMLRVGVCGTDFHLVETRPDGVIRCTSPLVVPPEGRIIGHEGVGEIREIGQGVENLSIGDLVCCESIQTCGLCRACRYGRFNQCDKALLMGLQTDGLFTEFADVPSRMLHRVTDLVKQSSDLDGLACLEPAAVAFLACTNARVAPGDSVLVIGAGPIGYLAAQLARQVFGASRICVSEPIEFRRNHVSSIVDNAMHPSMLKTITDGFDVVIEAAGALDDMNTLVRLMRSNGRMALLARTGGSLTIDCVDDFITKSLTLVGSRGHLGGAFDALIELLRGEKLDLSRCVTRVVSGLNELVDLLQNSTEATQQDCKVTVDLSGVDG